MKKIYLILVAVLMSLSTSAQTVVVVPDISKYTGTDQYVYNEADGKTYVRNNIGAYELYGLYEEVNTLTVKSADGVQKVSYLKNDNGAYIDLGYKPTKNTRIEAEFIATDGPDWKALYGTRFQANTQNGVEFPGTDNYSSGNGWKPGFAFFTTNGAINLGGETIAKDKMIFDQKIKTVQDATTADLKIYLDGVEASTIIDQTDEEVLRPLTNNCETSLYIFAINKHLPVIDGYNSDPNAFGDNSDPCINQWVTLYSLKIYEGSTLKYDLVPVLYKGKGGLMDDLSGNVFTSANEKDFVVPDEAGITVYEGKVVIYNGHSYQYTGGTFVDKGAVALGDEIADVSYKNMNNWTTYDDMKDVFEGKIEYNEVNGTNHIENYVGKGGYEPLWKAIETEPGVAYNYSFTFSCDAWESWTDQKMKAFVFSADKDFGSTNNGGDFGGEKTLGSYQLPTDATEDLPVSIDFQAVNNKSRLVFHFGYVKDETSYRFYFDNLKIRKYNYPAYPSLNAFGPQIEKLLPEIEEAELNTTVAIQKALDDAVTEAKASLDGNNLAAQQAALEKLQKAFSLAKDVDVTILQKTITIAKAEGVSTADAEDFIQNGTENKLSSTLDALRVARKVAHMETDNATYAGNALADGDFYLYNVGRKAYLTNGSDWGTHAALGFPGLEATLAANGDGYTIQFNELIQGEVGVADRGRDKFLGGSPYVDCWDENKGTYIFEPVSGKTNVFTIKGDRGYLAFDPDGAVDGGGIKHFNTVTAMWAEPKNEDAQWMLVSRADREAQLDKADAENPVDASFVIKNASFNKWADNGVEWTGINQYHYDGGDTRNFGDKNTEHYHGDDGDDTFSLSQSGINLPKAGWYELTVQAYFRDGEINPHVESVQNEVELAEAPVLWATFTEEETPLMYIHAEADKAPGEGTDTKIGNFPNSVEEAAKFFENGLYKNTLLFYVSAADLTDGMIGIDEISGVRKGSWIVADNFRLKYYGNGEQPTGIETVTVKTDGETTTTASPIIFNLAGQRLSSPRKGINIINGKKIVMK